MKRQENITYVDYSAPAGTVVDHIVLTFTGNTAGNIQTQSVASGAQPVPVDLADDSYTVTAQAVDASENSIGPAVTDTFSITNPAAITVQIPGTLTGTTS